MNEKEWKKLLIQGITLLCIVLLCCVYFDKGSCKKEINVAAKDKKPNIEMGAAAVSTASSISVESQPKVIVLDAGHGGIDEGASSANRKVQEKKYTLLLARKVKYLLEQKGIIVCMTRTQDADVTKACRVQLANTAGANLFVSIHCNTSDAWDTSANGLECLYATNKKALAAKNKKLAKTILHSLTKTTRLKKRGVIKRNGLYILRKAKIPSTIVEVGYLSNKKDLKTIIKESGQNAIAQGISDGIIQALEGNR